MKKISKILTGLLSAIAIGSIAIVPMDASALAKLLGYDSNGKEIYGGYFDELVGFDEDGNPIIVNTDPSITIATATPIKVTVFLFVKNFLTVMEKFPFIKSPFLFIYIL